MSFFRYKEKVRKNLKLDEEQIVEPVNDSSFAVSSTAISTPRTSTNIKIYESLLQKETTQQFSFISKEVSVKNEQECSVNPIILLDDSADEEENNNTSASGTADFSDDFIKEEQRFSSITPKRKRKAQESPVPSHKIAEVKSLAKRSRNSLDYRDDENGNKTLHKKQNSYLKLSELTEEEKKFLKLKIAEAKRADNTYECKECGSVLSSSQGIGNHIYAQHIVQSIPQQYLTWISNTVKAARNVDEATGNATFKCSFCDKIFISDHGFRYHLKKTHLPSIAQQSQL
jgi:uncharacterized C2H2 Zn-finger protein